MGDAQGKLEFTPDISESSIRQWLSLPRADPRRLFFYVRRALSGIRNRFALPIVKETGRHRTINPRLRQSNILHPTHPGYTVLIPEHCSDILLPHNRRFYPRQGVKAAEDVKSCIRYFRYLHRQWHEVSMKFPVPVATYLVHALAIQAELELGDVDQDFEEMADLCDELLNSDMSIRSLTDPISHFARAIIKDLELKSSEKVTDCLRKAIVRLPGLHQVVIVLAQSLYNRFAVAPSDDDYEEGMEILDRILTFRGSGDEPSPYREVALA